MCVDLIGTVVSEGCGSLEILDDLNRGLVFVSKDKNGENETFIKMNRSDIPMLIMSLIEIDEEKRKSDDCDFIEYNEDYYLIEDWFFKKIEKSLEN